MGNFYDEVERIRGLDNSAIGKAFRARRATFGYSQAEVAEIMTRYYDIPWHQTAVAKIESGSRPPRLIEAVALAHLYAISIEDLVRGENIVKHPDWWFVFDGSGELLGVDIGIGEPIEEIELEPFPDEPPVREEDVHRKQYKSARGKASGEVTQHKIPSGYKSQKKVETDG